MWNDKDILFEVDCFTDCNNAYHLELRTAAFTCNVPGNEQTSDIYELVWLVLDEASGQIVDTIRQSDRRLVYHQIRVGQHFTRGRSRVGLILRPSMPWVATDDVFLTVSAPTIDDLPAASYLFDIQFGCPSDLPFLGENWSYGEGADSYGNWFHCKRFRWANNHLEIRLPRSSHGVQTVQLNANVPVAFEVSEANSLRHDFTSTDAARWFQQDYRWTVRSAETDVIGVPAAWLQLHAKTAMPGLQADMRELFAAVESIESTVHVDRVTTLPVAALLNEGYRGGRRSADGDPRIALLHHFGNVGTVLPPSSGREQPIIDVLIFVDPIHDEVAAHRLEMGAVWLNSAQGAALACRKLGLLAGFGGLDAARTLRPSLIIIPRQMFLSEETTALLAHARAHHIRVLQEADFHVATMRHWSINEYADYLHRSDWVFEDGAEFPEMWKVFVPHFSEDSHHYVLIHANTKRLPIGLRHREFHNEHLILGSFFYNFFNYGLHPQLQVLEKLLMECLELNPLLKIEATAPASYAAGVEQGRIQLDIYGSGAGLFPYHGIARAFSAIGTGERTRLGLTKIRIRCASLEQLDLHVTAGRLIETSIPDEGAVAIVIEGSEHIQITFADIREGH